MAPQRNILEKIRKGVGLDRYGIPILMVLMLSMIIVVVYYSQKLSEQTSLPPIVTSSSRDQYEIAKLTAEIRQIRSETSGSLFWLKMIALFVTVGGAVGGYLVGQKQTTRRRLEFENLKNIDAIYQSMVVELADNSSLLRAAAAVRLGMILKSFPTEWVVDDARRKQMIQLTRQVLAASLAIEKDPKVLKTLTCSLVLHQYSEADPNKPGSQRVMGDVRELDLSAAEAVDAYWARVNFSYSDFYKANLRGASFRGSILRGAQFREAILREAVLSQADCEGANFKLADLRKADLTNAILTKARFEDAKVFDCMITGATFGNNPDVWVDVSEAGDDSQRVKFTDWLTAHQAAKK